MKRMKGFNGSVLFNLILVSIVLTLAGVSSSAEKFPSKEIIIICNYSAGGASDLSARVGAEYLKKELGVPVVVENRPEGGSMKGVTDVYRAKPDGYMLLANQINRNCQLEAMYKPPFKILEMTYLAGFQRADSFVVVNKDSPYKSLKDLVEASKKKSLNCSTAGWAGMAHFCAEMLRRKVGVNLEIVAFKGSAPGIIPLLGGNVDMAVTDQLTVLLHKEKLRPLGIFAEKRCEKFFPEAPTLKELGYDIKLTDPLVGICGPPGLPEEIRKILSDALAKAIKNPEFIDKIEKLGMTYVYVPGPEYYAAAVAAYNAYTPEEYKDIFGEEKK